MANRDPTTPKTKLRALCARLVVWLTESAYPLWAEAGIDPENGGFIETVAQNGKGLPHPRRARVHPRQIYAFAHAGTLGWKGDAAGIITRGSHYFETVYRRGDGLFRTLAAVDGVPLDDQAMLYDQAFALLGYAAAGRALDACAEFEKPALALRRAIERYFGDQNGAFRSNASTGGLFESNPHMHLLEAYLAWTQSGTDPGWAAGAERLIDLAMNRFIKPATGALGEAYTFNWSAAPGVLGRIVEPGHQFEWAWLLLRSEGLLHLGAPRNAALRNAALRLIAIGEQHGVHHQVAVNSLLDDFSIYDANARFWPQTERLKAALLAAHLTDDERYWTMAVAAGESFFPYIDTPVPGLWWDLKLPNGEIVDSPAPASTFYHLVGAITVLRKTMSGR